jgi:hypothetical protein
VERYVFGAVAVIVGALLVLFRRPFAELQVRSQNQVWGFRTGPRSEAVSRTLALIVGAGFIVVGLLMLAGIGKMRP